MECGERLAVVVFVPRRGDVGSGGGGGAGCGVGAVRRQGRVDGGFGWVVEGELVAGGVAGDEQDRDEAGVGRGRARGVHRV